MTAIAILSLAALGLVGCDLTHTTAESVQTPSQPAATNQASNAASPVQPIAANPPALPPNLPDPAREVVNLAHHQVEDGVLTNFVANVKEPFQLNADQIVYLRDLGVSPAVIEALLVRQQQLDAVTPSSAEHEATSPPASATASSAPTPAPAAAPVASVSTTAATSYPGGNTAPPTPTVGPAENVAAPANTEAQPSVTNYNYFYDSLAPYGSWVTVPTYGYVWQPSCAVITPGWRPYWNSGSWVWSDCGWYWNSYYSWGWAPFHYGNWCQAPGYGWCWVPGSTWAPSWVTFRYSNGYCGWAPLPAGCGWQSGVGLTWAGSGVSVGFSFGFTAAQYCWTPTSYFTTANCYRYGVHGAQTEHIYNNSTVVNNYIVGNNNTIINNGIDPSHVQKYSRSEVRKMQLADVNSPSAANGVGAALARPGQPNALPVYRPAVSTASVSTGNTARTEVRPTTASGTAAVTPTRFQLPSRPDSASQANPASNPQQGSLTPPRTSIGRPVDVSRSQPGRIATSPSSIARPGGVPAASNGQNAGPAVIPNRSSVTSNPRPAAPAYPGQYGANPGNLARLEPRKPDAPAPTDGVSAPSLPSSQAIPNTAARSYPNPGQRPTTVNVPARTPMPAYQSRPVYSQPQGSSYNPRPMAPSSPALTPAPRSPAPTGGGGGGGGGGYSGANQGRPGARPAP